LGLGSSFDIEDDDLREWCEDNDYFNHIVETYDIESQLIWLKDCPYSVQFKDLR